MVWRWVDDDDESSVPKGFSDLSNPNPRDSSENQNHYSTRRIVKSSCRTEEVEPGKFVRKCEKTEQILRDSIGRPTEVVESKTTHTEDDVSGEISRGLRPFNSSSSSTPFSFPGLHSDIKSIERGFGEFLNAAEDMANGFFQAFNIPSRHERDWLPPNRQIEKEGSPQVGDTSPYSELSAKVTDV